MKQALIDIGSNSMRLTVYELGNDDFKVLFKQKYMAGLAGYVEDGRLTGPGILKACSGLSEFRNTLNSLGIQNTKVFATASHRNISNTEETVHFIEGATGYPIEIISGREEAALGYYGAMLDHDISDGAYIDIGGASTEVVTYSNGNLEHSASFPVGSLYLFKNCVKKILPGLGSFDRMEKELHLRIDEEGNFPFTHKEKILCTGGTSRALMKTARNYFNLSSDCNSMSREQLEEICAFFVKGRTPVRDLILKTEPERIHTLIPGTMILQHVVERLDADEIVIGKYGVREGYLCQRLMHQK